MNSSSLAAISDFEAFLNTSLNQDISSEIEEILRSSQSSKNQKYRNSQDAERIRDLYSKQASIDNPPLPEDTSNARYSSKSTLVPPSVEQSDARNQTYQREYDTHQTPSGIGALASKIDNMQLQINDLILSTSAKAPPPPLSSSKKPIPRTPSSSASATSLDNMRKELKDLRTFVLDTQQQQSTVTATLVKSCVKKEIKKRDQRFMDEFVLPQVTREMALAEARLARRIDMRLAGMEVVTNELEETDAARSSLPVPRPVITLDPSFATTTSTDDSGGWNEEDSSIQFDSGRIHSSHANSHSAEDELNDLMARLKADLEERERRQRTLLSPKTPPAFVTHANAAGRGIRGGSGTAGTVSKLKKTSEHYAAPTFASRLKRKEELPAWK